MGAGPGCAGAELAGPAAGEHGGQVSDGPRAGAVALRVDVTFRGCIVCSTHGGTVGSDGRCQWHASAELEVLPGAGMWRPRSATGVQTASCSRAARGVDWWLGWVLGSGVGQGRGRSREGLGQL